MLNYHLLTAALFTAAATAAPIDLSHGLTDLARKATAATTDLTHGLKGFTRKSAVPTSGCGKSQESGYNGPFNINSGGLSRSYKVMHGRGGDSNNQHDNSQYYNYAASSKYIAVYPQGVQGSDGAAWQGPSYADQSVDDIKFVSELLNQVKSDYCIDTDRIYASGKSNGAGFVDTLACSDTGDQFAAFAMASAALYTDTSKASCNKKRAMLEAHGDSDNTVPYKGGKGNGGDLPKISSWVRWWGERNCGTGAESSKVNKDGYHITTFGCGAWEKSVTHYHLYEPAAHCWPDVKADNSDAKTIKACAKSTVLDFTPVVFDWFGRWNLQNAPQ